MRIVVLGCGRMGSWLCRVLARENEVAVYDTDGAKDAGPGVERLEGIEGIGGFRPDMLVNAVTLGRAVDAFRQAAPYLSEGCIISDVASIKGRIAEYYRTAGFPFASVHPMFGPTFADLQRVEDENAVVITESCAEGKAIWKRLFARLGLRVFAYSFEEHDRMMAYSLSTPFIASLVFASCVDARAVPGTTFKRHMAIAQRLLTEDDGLLSEILFNPHSAAEIERITSRLEFLKHVIRAQDGEEAKRFFRRLRENIGKEPPSP